MPYSTIEKYYVHEDYNLPNYEHINTHLKIPCIN